MKKKFFQKMKINLNLKAKINQNNSKNLSILINNLVYYNQHFLSKLNKYYLSNNNQRIAQALKL